MNRIFDRPSRHFVNVELDHLHGCDVPAARLAMRADNGRSISGIVLGDLVSVAHHAIAARDLDQLGRLLQR